MKIVVSGGGTGGHIYPAITIANQIKNIDPTAQIIFVGTEHGYYLPGFMRNDFKRS